MCHTQCREAVTVTLRGHRCDVANYIHADTSWPVLPPRWEGNSVHRPPSPTGANQRKLQARWACQSGNWKAACFDWIPNRSHLSGIRALIISPPHQSALLHQRKRVECHGEPSNFIRRVYLFIYYIFLLLLLLAHPILPVVSFPKWISGSQRREL